MIIACQTKTLMALTAIIPKIFYADIHTGLRFFVNGLAFEAVYCENGFAIVRRNGITIHLMHNEQLAAADRPELRIVTDNIDEFYKEVKARCPELLHPNLNVIKQQSWGLLEFALRDDTGVCLIVEQ